MVSKWKQIEHYFPPHSLLIGFLYCQWLLVRRDIRRALHIPRRRWVENDYSHLCIIGQEGRG